VINTLIIFLLLLLSVCKPLQATQVIIVNMDGPGEGFNDSTPVSPVGGNSGVTIGQQRLQVFEFAARIWESTVSSNVPIKVEAKFDSLTCTSTSAILGSAGPITVHRDFNNAPKSNTVYASSLANSLANIDLASTADITAIFNGDIDNNNACLGSYNWYYGLDAVKPSSTIELLSVVMHEIGHGLGFLTFVNISTGEKFGRPARDDAYMLNLEDHSLNKNWNEMSNSQRQASVIDTADLHWTGLAVTSKLGDLTGGVNQGHIRMYAPSPLLGGSSVSHFSDTLSPNELMEPIDTGPKQGPGLTGELLQDIGWSILPNFRPVISQVEDTVYSQSTNEFDFIVRDIDDLLSSLIITTTSSNPSVINSSGLQVTGSGNVRKLTLSPLSAGVSTIGITVFDGKESVSINFILTVLNTTPFINIDTPDDNANFAEGSEVIFQANASDIEDGDLDSFIAWSSSIDGFLGSGNIINSVLSLGNHQISASVTDSLSDTAIAVIGTNILGDSDNDQMNDAWEINSFGGLTRDGTGDYDGNGITDLDEYLISVTVPNGDINNDGLVNIVDALLVTQHINGFSLLTPVQIARGDIYPADSPDGIVNVSDFILLKIIVN